MFQTRLMAVQERRKGKATDPLIALPLFKQTNTRGRFESFSVQRHSRRRRISFFYREIGSFSLSLFVRRCKKRKRDSPIQRFAKKGGLGVMPTVAFVHCNCNKASFSAPLTLGCLVILFLLSLLFFLLVPFRALFPLLPLRLFCLFHFTRVSRKLREEEMYTSFPKNAVKKVPTIASQKIRENGRKRIAPPTMEKKKGAQKLSGHFFSLRFLGSWNEASRACEKFAVVKKGEGDFFVCQARTQEILFSTVAAAVAPASFFHAL